MEYEELRACRVCFATEYQLYSIHENGILDTFSEVTGILVSPTDGMPRHLCVFCNSLLKKSFVFRSKCREAQTYLQRMRAPITNEFLRSLDLSHLKLPLSVAELEAISLPEDLNDNFAEVKEETNDIDFSHEPNDRMDTDFDGIEFDDGKVDIDLDSNESLDEKLIDLANGNAKEKIFIKTELCEKDKKVSKKVKDKIDKEKKAIKKKLQKYSKDCKDSTKKVFYEFVLDKYFNNHKDNKIDYNLDILDFMEDKNILLEEADSNTVKEKNLDPIKKAFYSYVKDKYVEKRSKKGKVAKVKKKKDKRYKGEANMLAFAKMYNFELVFLNTREEQYAELVVRKQSLKYKKGKYRCDYCFFGFQTENVYKNHMAVHDPNNGDHVCDVCNTRFHRNSDLMEHQRRHHLYKYTCRECGKCVPYSSLAKQHYQFHKGIKYECEHCGKKYSKYSSRLDHIRIHHATTVCEICYETFQGPLGLRSHKTKIHKDMEQCGGCNRYFDNRNALDRHNGGRDTCDNHLKPCTKCGFNFPTAEQLNDHVAQAHSKQKTAEQGYTMKKRIVRKKNLYCACVVDGDADQLDGTGNVPVPVDQDSRCEGCGLLRKKRKPKKFLCEICADRMFTSEAALKYHQRIHTGERPYQCPMCPKRFRVKENLHNHVNTHTGERPYKCPHCPKAFRTNTANHRHQLVHTKKRPYRCDICDKTFQTSTYLKIHVRTVHMKIPMPPRVRNRKRHIE